MMLNIESYFKYEKYLKDRFPCYLFIVYIRDLSIANVVYKRS